MQLPERFNNLMEGQPGAVVDEDYTETDGPFLYYAFYDDDGYLTYYANFERNASPADIAEILSQDADELLRCYPDDMTLEEVYRKVDELREQARNVPGLEVKGNINPLV
jgi:hypothetical protein